MEDIINILQDFKNEIANQSANFNALPLLKNKTRLYLEKFSDGKSLKELDSIPQAADSYAELNNAYNSLSALIETLVEEIKIESKYKILSQEQYNELKKGEKFIESLSRNYNQSTSDLDSQKASNSQLTTTVTTLSKDVEHLTQILKTRDTEIAELKNSQENIKQLLNTENSNFLLKENELKDNISAEKTISTELRKELSKLKEQTQKSEIIKNSAKFKNQADSSKKNATKWVAGVVISLILFVCVLFWGFSSNEELFNIATNILGKSKGLNAEFVNKLILIEVAKKIGTKALIYSMFIYFITFLVKNYNAQMHNYIVNSHKSNALSSTVDLIGTAREDEGNDKIILQATQAIFATHKSGYQGAENEPTSPNLITNVIDSFSSKK